MPAHAFSLSLVIAASTLAAAEKGNEKRSNAEPPNIVLIVTDDQGWWDLSLHGNPVLQTPAMDQLARDGVEFNRFYVCPVCSLTRACLMTGRYYPRTGCFDTRFGHDTMRAGEVTIAELLQQAGYRTGMFGKWHLGRYMPQHPNQQGFDEFFGFWKYGHVERYFYPDRMWHNREPVACRGYITDLITDAAIEFVDSSDKRPFFCYVPYNVPHYPFQVENEFVEPFLKQGVPLADSQMYGMLRRCDDNIARLMKALDDRGLRDNTIVLFLSDNGGVSKYYRAGLRGNKGNVYEGGILSPLFVRWPQRFRAGAKTEAICHVIDLLPTCCELAGVELPRDRPIDGKSLLPLLLAGGGDSPHEYLFHTWNRDRPQADRNWAVCDARYKLVNGQLFDMHADRGEKHDLAADDPERVTRMRGEYLKWLSEVCAGQSFRRERIEVGRADENPVELQVSWADLSGDNTRYTFNAYDWDAIDGWNKPGDAALWQIDVVRAGRYEVELGYGSRSNQAGGTFRISCGASHVAGRVEPTPVADAIITRNVGTLELLAGKTELKIEAVDLTMGELMILNRVQLRRIDER